MADLRHALRGVRRRPALAATIITTLALGIGANTAMFSVIDATLLRPLPYPHADRVVYLKMRSADTGALRDPTAAELQEWVPRLHSFERIEGRRWRSVLLTGAEGATRVRMLDVTTGFLDALGARPVAGRFLRPEDGEPGAAPVTVLSAGLWRGRYGARPEIVGTAIAVDEVSRVIVGVAPEIASDTPGLRFALYAPLPRGGPVASQTPARGVAWLKPGVSLAAASAEFQVVSSTVDEHGRRSAGELVPPSNIFWDVREFRDSQLALLGAVFLLLMISCVNVANLLLAAGQVRRGEFAVRRALGAGRFRVARLLLIESLVLAVAGSAAGIVVAWGGLQLFAALEPGPQLQTRLEAVRLDGPILAYAVGIALVTGVIFGVVPALRGSATPLGASLREADHRTGSRLRRLPGALIVVEVALSVVLLMAAGLVGRGFLQMRFSDPGFAADRVLAVRVALPEAFYPSPEQRAAFFEPLLAQARRLPGVTGATLGYGAVPPTDFMRQGGLDVDGQAGPPVDARVEVSFVGPGYFEVMGISLLAGSGFDAADLRNSQSAVPIPTVVNQKLARRFWPDREAVGATFTIADSRGPRRYRVIGIAGDVGGRALVGPNCPSCGWQMYQPLMSDRQWTDVLVRVADGAPPPVAGLRSAINQIDARVPADDGLQTAAASLQSFIAIPRFQAVLFGTFAALALALAALGLSAVVSHAVSQRTREMGIRLALGAQRSQVRGLVLSQGMRPVLVGLGAGLLVSAAVTRAMDRFLHGISPSDPLTFMITAAVLLGAASCAVLILAMRATRVNPVEALRSE